MKEYHKECYQNFLTVYGDDRPDEYTERDKRIIFLAEDVLGITTYCGDYSLRIGERILDVMKFINFKKSNSETLRPKVNDYFDVVVDEDSEFTYILYVQFIKDYLNWGTNIYYPWFDSKKEILGYKLTPENVSYLISWFDCTEEL